MSRSSRLWSVAALMAVLVNLPLVHSTWTDTRVSNSGVEVTVPITVPPVAAAGSQHVVQFRFPARIDPARRPWTADLTPTAYAAARRTGSLVVRVVPGDPSAYTVRGEATSDVGLVVTILADLALVGMVLLARRYRGTGPEAVSAVALGDVERCRPDSSWEELADGSVLVRGEVVAVEEDAVVIDAGTRSVRVALEGHRNPVGHQQPAQVRVLVQGRP